MVTVQQESARRNCRHRERLKSMPSRDSEDLKWKGRGHSVHGGFRKLASDRAVNGVTRDVRKQQLAQGSSRNINLCLPSKGRIKTWANTIFKTQLTGERRKEEMLGVMTSAVVKPLRGDNEKGKNLICTYLYNQDSTRIDADLKRKEIQNASHRKSKEKVANNKTIFDQKEVNTGCLALRQLYTKNSDGRPPCLIARTTLPDAGRGVNEVHQGVRRHTGIIKHTDAANVQDQRVHYYSGLLHTNDVKDCAV
ncbi:hypothetical protein Btru_074968 [Bulinus truncatus]|nr:hypothetical protein Btru_074968 [Bulinus truncatus]